MNSIRCFQKPNLSKAVGPCRSTYVSRNITECFIRLLRKAIFLSSPSCSNSSTNCVIVELLQFKIFGPTVEIVSEQFPVADVPRDRSPSWILLGEWTPCLPIARQRWDFIDFHVYPRQREVGNQCTRLQNLICRVPKKRGVFLILFTFSLSFVNLHKDKSLIDIFSLTPKHVAKFVALSSLSVILGYHLDAIADVSRLRKSHESDWILYSDSRWRLTASNGSYRLLHLGCVIVAILLFSHNNSWNVGLAIFVKETWEFFELKIL